MEYEVLYYNDNNTAKVRMIISGNILEQDFATDNLDANVKEGMAIFQIELANSVSTPIDASLIGEVVKIAPTDLPIIPAEDFIAEAPSETPITPSVA